MCIDRRVSRGATRPRWNYAQDVRCGRWRAATCSSGRDINRGILRGSGSPGTGVEQFFSRRERRARLRIGLNTSRYCVLFPHDLACMGAFTMRCTPAPRQACAFTVRSLRPRDPRTRCSRAALTTAWRARSRLRIPASDRRRRSATVPATHFRIPQPVRLQLGRKTHIRNILSFHPYRFIGLCVEGATADPVLKARSAPPQPPHRRRGRR
jgi:hypothetical protein